VRNLNVTINNVICRDEVHEIFIVAKTMEQNVHTAYREKCEEEVDITDKNR
jgi:hypothetical protein